MQTNLEDKLDGEDAGEDKVEEVKDGVPRWVFPHRVLSGEGDARRTDDDHDEEIKVTQVDDKVTEPTHPVKARHII